MPLILYLNGEQLDVYQTTRHQVARVAQFATDADGQAAFADYMAAQPVTVCRILADLIEEEFRQETLPHVGGRDRKALHERHAARMFRTSAFRHSRVIGREPNGRRDDRVLFSAITNHELVEPWVRILERCGHPLYGIHSLPILSRRVAWALGVAGGKVLLITLQRGNRLRETFLHDNQVCFSRLAPVPDADSARFGFTVKAEVEKTRRYLTTLKLLGFEERLSVHVICDGAYLDAVRSVGTCDDYCDGQTHSLHELAERFGITGYPDDSYSDLIFVTLLSRARVPNHYAQPAHGRLAIWHRARTAIHRTSLAIVAGAALWSLFNVVDALALDARKQALSADLQKTQLATQAISGLQKQVTADPKDILAAVEIADRLEARRMNPHALLSALGSAIQRSPDIALDKLTWSLGPAPVSDGDATDDATRVVVTLEGHIRHFDGSYLHADQEVARLSKAIGDLHGVTQCKVTRHPANAAPDASLNGSVNAEQGDERASFAVQYNFGEDHG